MKTLLKHAHVLTMDDQWTAFEDGYVLQPGDQFSFNSVVGQRTEENGFFPAIEYAYGEHVMGIGGGVCRSRIQRQARSGRST